MSRCCMRCRAIPGACGLQGDCRCHRATAQARADRLSRELEDAARAPHRSIPEGTQRAILAAQCGYDGAKEVARQHRVPVGVVVDIWREGRRGD